MLNEKYQAIVDELKNKFPTSLILAEEPMKSHTTFKIGGPADIYIEPDYATIIPLISFLKERDVKFIVIGNGSNLLVSDKGIEGVVISLGKKLAVILLLQKQVPCFLQWQIQLLKPA